MIPLISRDRESKERAAILRGVYEDNLKIIGKSRTRIANSRIFYIKRGLLIVLLTMAAVFLQNGSLHGTFFGERQVTAGLITPVPSRAAQKTASFGIRPPEPSDYKAFIDNKGAPLKRTFGLGIRTIMIDPGHGGADVGTTGKLGTREKDVALDIALRLKSLLEKEGRYNVLMTRDSDVTLPLNRRVELALQNKADLFLSIHLNSLPQKPLNIIETYYFGPSNDSKILHLAEQENTGSDYGLSDFREIIEKIGDTMKLQESSEFAASIQKNLYQNFKKENGNAYDFGVKRAPFVVLLGVEVPAVLAEVSCLSNKQEEMKLMTPAHREQIAQYLERGILDYLNKGEATYDTKYADKK
jgi:N-acetylmuramoyl-L-alanine amidase